MNYKEWTIEVTGRTENGHAFLVDVQATKGGVVKTRQFDGIVSIDGLKSAVKGWIDNDELKTTLPDTGALDFTEPTPETSELTQAEKDKADWDADRARLRTLMELVADGVVPADHTSVSSMQSKVRNGFKPEYLG